MPHALSAMQPTTVKALLLVLTALLTLNAAGQTSPVHYNVKADIRFGYRFYSIHISPQGSAYVLRGKGSVSTEPFSRIMQSDTSRTFRWLYVKRFYAQLRRLRAKPYIEPGTTADAPRTEIYLDDKKVYDGYGGDERYWDMFRPMAAQLPGKFNPFALDDHPFQ